MFELRRTLSRGCRALIAGAALGLLSVSAPTGAEPMTLNLKDADLSAVIATVSEMTGRNFIVDPRVKGKVTVVSSQPLEADQIYQVFLSILSVHGFAAVPSGNAIKIIPEVNAKQSAIPTIGPRSNLDDDQYVTEVIALRNVDPTQLVPILRPLVAQQGHLASVPGARMLVISAEASNVQRLADIVHRIDRGGSDGVELIPLKHANAVDVVRVLQGLQQSGGGSGGQGAAPGVGTGAPTLAADERTNSVLIGGIGTERTRLKALVAQLDTPNRRGGNTEVIYLRYANAKDMAQVLAGVSDTLTSARGGTGGGSSGSGGFGSVSAPGSIGGGLTGGFGSSSGTGGGAASTSPVSLRREGVSIQADPATNALIITAPRDVLTSIKDVVRQLDVRRAQVLVEAVIAEITYDKTKEFGVQWGYDASNAGGPVGLLNFNGTGAGSLLGVAGGLVAASASPSADTLTALGNAIGNGGTFLAGDTNPRHSVRFGAFIRALANDSDANILSTPTLVTMDNEEAQIVVGQNVPFLTGSYANTGGGTTPANPFTTVQRQDVGLTLKIKPQINEGDAVKLEISQEVSNLADKATLTSQPVDVVTNKRAIKTVVMVDSGQAVVLGGLVEDQISEGDQRLPLLGDIPVLGNLFAYKHATKSKRNLMVFLHPVILRDAAQNAAATGAKYKFIRDQQVQMQEHPVNVMPQETRPVLPAWNKYLELPPPFEETQRKNSTLPPPPPDIGPQGQL